MGKNIVSIECYNKRPDFYYVAAAIDTNANECAEESKGEGKIGFKTVAVFTIPDEPQKLMAEIINEACSFAKEYNVGRNPSLDNLKSRVDAILEKKK